MKTASPSARLEDLVAEFRHSLNGDAASLFEAALHEANRLNASLYLVGGPVRDLLLRRSSADLDLVTEGNAEMLARRIGDAVGSKAVVYSRFGTATVNSNGERLDLTTARREIYEHSGALPTVSVGTIDEDLQRRDFTVNAIALGLTGRYEGRILDPTGGMRDLRRGVIKILHSGSFQDDPTRIFRAIRYEQRLRFRLEDDTKQRLTDALKGRMLSTVSADRLRRDLALILEEEHPVWTLIRAGNLGVMQSLYSPLRRVEWLRAFGEGQEKREPLTLLAALAYPMNELEAQGFIRRLNMPTSWSGAVTGMAQLATLEPLLKRAELSPVGVFRKLDGRQSASIRALMQLTDSSVVKQRLSCYLERQRFVRPMLRGGNLVELGVPEGPSVGEILRLLLEARLEGEIATLEEERAMVMQWLAGHRD